MPVVDVSALTYEPITLTASDFTAARDDDSSLSSGVVGEIATSEVGSDGQLSGYDAVQVGQPESNNTGDRKGNEIFFKFQAGSSDIADTAQIKVSARQKGELGGGTPGSITGWIQHRGQDTSDPAQRRPLYPAQPIVKNGRLVQILAKDETASLTVDLSESTFEIPALGGK